MTAGALLDRGPLARTEPGDAVPALGATVLAGGVLRVEDNPVARRIVRLAVKVLLGNRSGVRPGGGLSDYAEGLFFLTILN